MRARLLILSLLIFAIIVTIPSQSSAENAFIDFLQDRDHIADMTIIRGLDLDVGIDAVITIDVDYSTTVTLSARASGWTCVAEPANQFVLPGRTTIPIRGTFTVPSDESDGTYTASIVATWDTPGGTPIQYGNSTVIDVVQNRAGLGSVNGGFNIPAGGGYGIGVPINNRGSLEDEFNINAWIEDNGKVNPNITVTSTPSSLTIAPGEQEMVQLQLDLPEGLTAGDHTLIVQAISLGDSFSTTQQEVVWTSSMTSIPAPVDERWGPFLPIGLIVVFGSAMLFFGFTEVGLFALATILLPMYVRVKRDKVLDNFIRGQIYGYIKGNPGCTYTEIMESAGSGNGATTYHLSVLLREEFVVTTKDGLHRRFFPLGHPDRKKKFFPSRLQKDIIQYIRAHPGSSQITIAHGLEESKQVINYHIKILSEKGYLALDNRGRKTLCYTKEIPPDTKGSTVTVLANSSDA